MPRGPKGEWRPADVVGCAVHVMKIATGEIEEVLPSATAEASDHECDCEVELPIAATKQFVSEEE